MKRLRVILIVLGGLAMGWLGIRILVSRAETFYVQWGLDSQDPQRIETREYQVVIEQVKTSGEEEGQVPLRRVTIEPNVRWIHYWMAGMFGLFFVNTFFRNARENDETREEGNRLEDDPRYQEFVAEDESRRLVPGEVLEKDFAEWKEKDAGVENPERDTSV